MTASASTGIGAGAAGNCAGETMPDAAARLPASPYTLVTAQGVAFLMVLYDYMIEASRRYLNRPAIKRQEERAKGIRQADQEWEAWLARKDAAESRGLPFDEPPPSRRR